MLLQDRRGEFARGLIISAPSLTVGLLPRRVDEFRQPEIENLCVTLTRDHDVVGLEVAMHDPRDACFGQSFRYMLQMAQKLCRVGLLTMNQFPQRLTLDELH